MDYVRVFHVARHGETSWIDRIRDMDKGGNTIENILGYVSGLYGVFSRKEVCKCGRMFLRTPNCEWLHCYGVAFTDSHGIKVF